MRFDTRLVKAFLVWGAFVFIVTLILPASLNHSGGDSSIYTRTLSALRDSFSFGPDLYLAPGMSLFLWFASLLGGIAWIDYIRFLQFALWVILVLLTYHAGRLMFQSARAGALGASLMALSPIILMQLFSFGTDLLYAATFMAGIVFSLRLIRDEGRSSVNAIAAGAAFGYGALTDPIGLYVAPIVALWMIILLVLKRARPVRAAGLVLIFIATAAAFISPWYIRNAVVFGADEAPIVQKRIEKELITKTAQTFALVTYPFTHAPLAVLERGASMALIPPDLDFFDQYTHISYRVVAADLALRGSVPPARTLSILLVKTVILAIHVAILALAVAGFLLAFQNPAVWILPPLAGYVFFVVIGYGFPTFQGIAPTNEFLIPLYGLFYAFAGYAVCHFSKKGSEMV